MTIAYSELREKGAELLAKNSQQDNSQYVSMKNRDFKSTRCFPDERISNAQFSYGKSVTVLSLIRSKVLFPHMKIISRMDKK